MSKPNRGPHLVYHIGKGYKNPQWFVVWYQNGVRRERSCRTQDKAKAELFMNSIMGEIYVTPAPEPDPDEPNRIQRANRKEHRIQRRYARELPGSVLEAPTPAGTIDVLTAEAVIEIKAARLWKSAIGQILSYSIFEPRPRKIVHLFGTLAQPYRGACEAVCAQFNIELVWEDVARGTPSLRGKSSVGEREQNAGKTVNSK